MPRRLWDFIEALGVHDRILVASHDDSQMRRFRKHSRERVATSASRREALAFWIAARTGADRFLPVSYDALQVPRTFQGLTVVDRRFVQAAHRRGLQVHVWTIDDPIEARELVELGVDGIMSDRPDWLLSSGAAPGRKPSLRPPA
jgi:glycerophosphoryl diester phosphodiesterase